MNEYLSMDQVFINKITDIIHANLLNEKFGVEELAKETGISRSSIHRKLKSITHKSISQFIREIRIKRAMEMLQNNLGTASEIGFRVGFNSPAYFSKCFHEYYGYPPGVVEKRRSEAFSEKQPGLPASLVRFDHDHISNRRRKLLPGTSKIKFTIIFLAGIIIGFLVIYSIYSKDPKRPIELSLIDSEKSIAILPFINLSTDPESQYFADGVADNIRKQLSGIRELRVISHTTAEKFRGRNDFAQEIAKNLGTNFILEGSVQEYENKVRIMVSLINARMDQNVWSKIFDTTLSNIFAIQNDIAKNIAGELQNILSKNELEQIEKNQTNNPEAYKQYLKGRFLQNSYTEEELKASIKYFENSVAIDPDYSLAYGGLADAYYQLTRFGWLAGQEGYNKAKEFALRALEIDKNLSEAQTTLGAILYWNEWKWEEAREKLIYAIELNPNNANAYMAYAELLDILGQTDEAIIQINRAIELSPLNTMSYMAKAFFLYDQGKLQEALDIFTEVEELNSDFVYSYWGCFYSYLKQGKDLNAMEELQKIICMDTSTIKYYTVIKEIYNKSGTNGLMNWLIEIQHICPKLTFNDNSSPYVLAKWYAILDKKEEALDILEMALEDRSTNIPRINTNPDFDNLHSEARFKAIIKEIGLSKYQNDHRKSQN